MNFNRNLKIAIGINNHCNNIAELNISRPDVEKLANLLGIDNNQVGLLTDDTPYKPLLVSLYRSVGSLSSWLKATKLQTCCDRLYYHPIFTNPESIEDPEQRETAIAACKTCEKYVWSKAENLDE